MAAGAGKKSLQKVIILGDQGVGKTSLMQRYVSAKFVAQYKATIGADFSTKDVAVGDEMITLQIWDTAGQERFQSLGQAFYRGADACVLVYDVTSHASFERLETWREQFIKHGDVKDAHEFPFIVLGNKSDTDPSKHVVSTAAVKDWCASKGNIPHFVVSAKTGMNVDDAFLTVVKAAAKRVRPDDNVLPDTLKLTVQPSKESGCAC